MKKQIVAWLLVVSMILPIFSHADSLQENPAVEKSMNEPIALAELLYQANNKVQEEEEVEIFVVFDENYFTEFGEAIPAKLLYQDEYLRKQQDKGDQVVDRGLELLKESGLDLSVEQTFNTLFFGVLTKTSFKNAQEIARKEFVKIVEIAVERQKPTLDVAFSPATLDSSRLLRPMSEMVKPFDPRLLIGTQEVFENHKGEGTVVAVIDSGFDMEHRSFYLSDSGKAAAKLKEADVKALISGRRIEAGKYVNEKIPFAFNYRSKNTKIKEADKSSHGQHVAGIAAGNKVEYNSGKYKGVFSGVAPEAQLVLMRVFSDESGSTGPDYYNKALEDALVLKVDSVNMSLGAPAGDIRTLDRVTNLSINKLSEAGCVVAIAAGNDAAFGYDLNRKPDAKNPDYGLVGTPAIAQKSLAVASLQNDVVIQKYVDVFEKGADQSKTSYAIRWVDTDGKLNTDKRYEYVFVGFGKADDFKEDLSGKYALIERGEITFAEKVKNAVDHKAEGVVIFNSQAGGEDFITMGGVEFATVPVGSIVRSSGMKLAAEKNELKFSADEATFRSKTSGYISDFSSFGVTSDGEFKPEITAPGGNIYSLANDNDFVNQSGTSMASPQVAGGIALVKSRVAKEFAQLSPEQQTQLVRNLLMSTAKIHINPDTKAPSSPRHQGAGIMNLSGALSANVILQGDNLDTKIIQKSATDEQEIRVTIENLSSQQVEYNYETTVVVDEVQNGLFTLKPRLLKTIKGDKIVLAGNEKKEIVIKLDTTAESKELKEQMPNGYFVDGFVEFKNNDGELSIPFITFVGQLDKLDYVEKDIYSMVRDNEFPYYYKKNAKDYIDYQVGANYDYTHLFTRIDGKPQILGAQADFDFSNPKFLKTLAISPNGDNKADNFGMRFVMLRNGGLEGSIYRLEQGSRVEQSKELFGRGEYLKHFGNPQGDNSARFQRTWPELGKQVAEGNYELVVKQFGPNEKTQQGKDMVIPFVVDVTAPKVENAKFDAATRFLSFDASDKNGLFDVIVSYEGANGKVRVEKTAEGYLIPAGVELSAVKVTVVDAAHNRLELTGDLLTNLDNLGKVDVKLNWISDEDPNFKLNYKVVDANKKEYNPNFLPEGKYKLIIGKTAEEYQLPQGMEYDFEVTKDKKTAIVVIDIEKLNIVQTMIIVSQKASKVSKIVAKSKSTSEEIDFSGGKFGGGSLYHKKLPYGEYEIVVIKNEPDLKMRVLQLIADATKTKNEKMELGIFTDSFDIVINKDSELSSTGTLSYELFLMESRNGEIAVEHTPEDFQVDYLVSESLELPYFISSPIAFPSTDSRSAAFNFDLSYEVFPTRVPDGYYAVEPYKRVKVLKADQPTKVVFEYKEITGYGSVKVDDNSEKIDGFTPKYVAYNLNAHLGMRGGIELDDLSNLPYGTWFIKPIKDESNAAIGVEPAYHQVLIDENHQNVTVDFQYVYPLNTKIKGVIFAPTRHKGKNYSLKLTSVTNSDEVLTLDEKLGFFGGEIPLDGYKVEVLGLEDDMKFVGPEYITVFSTSKYNVFNLLIVPKDYDNNPVNSDELKALLSEIDSIITSDLYMNATEEKREAYQQAIEKGKLVLNDPLASQTAIDEAVEAIKTAKEALDGVKPPSNNPPAENGGGGGSSNASVRPDPAGSTKTPSTEIKEEKPPLADGTLKLLASLQIGSKEYKAFENGALVSKQMDVSPMLHQGRTMLPARVIAELLGIRVEFDEASKTAKFVFEKEEAGKKVENTVELTLGKKQMKVNGKEQMLSAEILNVDGRVLLPMTDVQKALKELGLKVDVKWEHISKTILLEEVK